MSDHSARGRKWELTRQAVLERDGFSCVVCKAAATHVDHIMPRSRGGSDDMDNLQAMCQTHNLKKGDRIMTRGIYWDTDTFPNGLPRAGAEQ